MISITFSVRLIHSPGYAILSQFREAVTILMNVYETISMTVSSVGCFGRGPDAHPRRLAVIARDLALYLL